MQQHGLEVSAYDPNTTLYSEALVSQVGDALAGAQLVIFAVPVGVLKDALHHARPHMHAAQIVIDVGSVKVNPTQALEEVCADEIPWVATHPLFGPDSLARGEAPLGVVVAPNSFHPHAVERVAELYRALGCDVRMQAPEEHDDVMAHTHALTFFIAKALVDLGIDRYVESAPPSFRALACTIASVRADAGHLMATIQRDNPFAAEARQALMDALQQLNRRLVCSDEVVDVPQKGENS